MKAFSWTKEAENIYFEIAEKKIKEAGFDDLIFVDRDKFTVIDDHVKIYIVGISSKKENYKIWQEFKKTDDFVAKKWDVNKFGKRCKPLFYKGYFLIKRNLRMENRANRRK